MSKKLQLLVIHCSATPAGRVVTPQDIRDWHLSPAPVGRGWRQVGYSDMILLDGTPVTLVAHNEDDVVDAWEITNGADGVNSIARHVVYVGGTDAKGNAKDTRTPAQLQALTNYVKGTIRNHPSIKIAGHNQFAKKACPSFDVPAWCKSIGIADANIYKS
jgi:N-acetylmuramoyl-L-alanine amidase